MRKKKVVQAENHDRYIITYADLLTLLLAFFVILYAMSDPNEEKINQLGGFFETVFSPRIDRPSLIETQNNFGNRTYGETVTDRELSMMMAVSEQNTLRRVKRIVDDEVKLKGLQDEVSTRLSDDGLMIILTNEVLFDSGSARIDNHDSLGLLNLIGGIINEFENDISIKGHTDNIPIHNDQFESNWELSGARALSVLNQLLERNKDLDLKRFSISGYGEHNPIDTNLTSEGRAKNRRVEIIIKRSNYQGLLMPKGG